VTAPAREQLRSAAAERSALRAVALPSEHGGWGLAAEPGLLGLLVAPSVAGAAIAVAAVVAFLLRTPLKLALVDRRRGRSLPRTRLAARVAAVEAVVLVGLAVVAVWSAGATWFVPLVLATPLFAVELWFDVRSRGRRLVPELCGSVGAASVAASVVVAGGAPVAVAVVAWAVLAARSIAAIPYVRTQVQRLHRPTAAPGAGGSDLAQAVGVAIAAAAVVVEPAAALGAVALAATAIVRVVGVRRPPVPAVRLGAAESALGVLVVVATAVGLHLGGAV
jgi:hypothetical protein